MRYLLLCYCIPGIRILRSIYQEGAGTFLLCLWWSELCSDALLFTLSEAGRRTEQQQVGFALVNPGVSRRAQ